MVRGAAWLWPDVIQKGWIQEDVLEKKPETKYLG